MDTSSHVQHSSLILIVGFGGVLVLMAYAGWNTMRALDQTEQRGARIQQDFVRRSLLLNQIRADVYISGTYVRDYLLEPERQRADAYRADLVHVHRDMEAAIDSYGNLTGVSAATPLNRLRSQLADYWRVLNRRWSGREPTGMKRGMGFFATKFFPGGKPCSISPTKYNLSTRIN